LSVFLSLLLSPLVTVLQKILGRVAASILTVALTVALLAGAGYLVGIKTMDLAAMIPQYKTQIREKILKLTHSAAIVGETVQAVQEIKKDIVNDSAQSGSRGTPAKPVPVEAVQISNDPLDWIGSLLGPLLSPLELLTIVIIFTIFMLIEKEDLRDRILRLAGTGDINLTSQAFDETATKIGRYLWIQSVINFGYGILVALGLYLLGIPDAPAWGVLVAVLRFVPYAGVWIAAAPPFFISLATTNGWQPAWILALFVVLEFTFPAFIEPFIVGAGVGISSLSLLVAAVFWTWLWGPVGLLLSTPLTVCLAVLGKYVPQLRFLNILLTNQPVLDPASRFYQRLLAGSPGEARQMVEKEYEQCSFAEVCDSVLLPTLVVAGEEHRNGRLGLEKMNLIRDTVSEIIAEGAERFAPASKPKEIKGAEETNEVPSLETNAFKLSELNILPEGLILCVPAKDEADQIAAEMFTVLLGAKGIPARTVSVDSLAGEVLDIIEEGGAEMICISALPPRALMHARYLCKRIRARFPEKNLVVGLWNNRAPLDTLKHRLGCEKNESVVPSYWQALQQIEKTLPQFIFKHRNAAGNTPQSVRNSSERLVKKGENNEQQST
jgi:predicted PurR-regulated permease PerM